MNKPMKQKRASTRNAKRFWKKMAAGLKAGSAAIGAFVDRYFGNGFRFKEFSYFVAAAFAAGIWLGTQLLLSPVRAQFVGYALAVVAAVAYVRNPKARDWQTGSPGEPNASDPANGSADETPEQKVDTPAVPSDTASDTGSDTVPEGKPYA